MMTMMMMTMMMMMIWSGGIGLLVHQQTFSVVAKMKK